MTGIQSNMTDTSPRSASTAPMLSVIVPVYNSMGDLKRCLPALAASDFDNFKVLVVDDGSTEPIEPVVREHGFDYLRIKGPGGPGRARNRGVEQVEGEVVLFVDADVVVHTDTLRRIAERFEADPTIDAVIGTYDDTPGHPGFLSQYKNLFHHYVHKDSHGEVSTFWSGCGAMRREVFRAFGGFDEVRYARPAIEDIELGTWVSVAGHRIVLDQHVQCQHLKRWTFRNLIKTDVIDRGIPWTRLMLRAGELPSTLNVKPTQRICVALVFLAVGLLAVGSWFPLAFTLAGLVAVVVTLMNLDFYRYLGQRRGPGFVIRVLPVHWLYFLYCGVAFGAGTFLHYWHGDTDTRPAVTPTVGESAPPRAK